MAIDAAGRGHLRYEDLMPLPGMTGDLEAMALYAGQSAGLIHDVMPAADIIRRTVAEAEAVLAGLDGERSGVTDVSDLLLAPRGRHHVLMTDVTAQRWMLAWWVGLAGHLVMLAWYAVSGLVAPPWAVIGLLVIWAALLLLGLRLRTTRPAWMLLIPVLDVAIWFGVVSAGDAFLGWTA